MFQLRVLPVLLLSLLVGIDASAEISVYRSNSVGMELEALKSGELTGEGYELMVEKAGRSESVRLYLDGVKVERWERSLSPEGRLLEQKHYAFAASGEEMIYREEYAYNPAGQLREITRAYPDGAVHIYSYGFAGHRLAEERIQQGKELFVSRYDDGGRLLEWAYFLADELAQKKVWEYYDGSDVPRSLTVMDLVEDLTIYSRFDEEGRVTEEEKTGSTAELTLYQRDRDGRLVARIKKGGKGREEWRYRYDDSGAVEREDYYLKGSLEKSRVYTAPDMWYEEIYQGGEVFLRITYREGKKAKEEFISEGKVVRERQYP